MRDLAAIVVDELELRLSAGWAVEVEAQGRRLAEGDAVSFHELSETLQAGLETNRSIGQAVGLLMAFHKVADVEAFEILRKSSQDTNVKLNQIAEQLIQHHNSGADDAAPQGSPAPA